MAVGSVMWIGYLLIAKITNSAAKTTNPSPK